MLSHISSSRGRMIGPWVLYGTIITTVMGHIQMSSPLPIRSPLKSDLEGEKDYSYTSPLSTTGWDFPCKGYHHDPFISVANYTAGQEYPLTLAGTATHGGGSCQISLSYDLGETFHVIKSIIGRCPEPLRYTFQIPNDAPRGPALLAWTWFNRIGNREMYMDCAQVTIRDPSAQYSPGPKRAARTRRLPWAERPPIFLANINAEGQCSTIEGDEVNFPMPGDDVEGAVQKVGYQCSGPAAFLSRTGQGATQDSSVAVFLTTSSSRSIVTPTSFPPRMGYSHCASRVTSVY